MRILAIDQGTTSTRGMVFDDDGAPLMVGSLRHRQIYPRAGWVEHDPRELLANVRACIDAAGSIDAIAIANQGESCLAWDAVTLEPISPVIVWQDGRTAPLIDRLQADGHGERVTARTGLPLDSYFSASKLGWILRELPAAQQAHTDGRLRLGTTDSYLIECLTGVWATDPTTASRTALMDLDRLHWDPALCDLFGVPADTLAPIRPTVGDFGRYGNIPIVASIVDQQAALFGHGARRAGDAKITFGTGAFALVHAGSDRPASVAGGLISTIAWQREDDTAYALEAGVYDAGAAIEWALRIGILGSMEELLTLSGVPSVESGVVFVPALSGLACPQWRRDARGAWTGMTMATTRLDLQRAILEGIAFQTREIIEKLDAQVGLSGAISVDGGVSGSDVFLQFLADASDRTISRSGNAELTAYGCALLAGHAGGPPAPMTQFHPRIGADQRRAWVARYRAAVDQTHRASGESPALSPFASAPTGA